MANVWKFTGNPENWLTAIQFSKWALNDVARNQSIWKNRIKTGDLVIFHSTGKSDFKIVPPAAIIGFGYIGEGKYIKEDLLWIQEINEGENKWPYVIPLERVHLLSDIESINFETPVEKKPAEQVIKDIKTLLVNALPLGELNKRAKKVDPGVTNFPALGSASQIPKLYAELVTGQPLGSENNLIIDVSMKIGESYTKEEIEVSFSTNFGPRIKGITLRKWQNSLKYIILFSTQKGKELYGDTVEGNIFYYKGEGLAGDQKETSANKALIDSVLDRRPIFGFRQKEKDTKFEYLGLLSVLDWALINYDGRKVYEFKLGQEGIDDPMEEKEAEKDIEINTNLPTPQLTDDAKIKTSTVSSIARDAVFARKIKDIYKNKCAICQVSRFSIAGNPEVQSAHIYPKERKGADDLRNGLALCRLHHWAFDSGLMSISNDLKVMISDKINKLDQNYEEIYKYKEKNISVPASSNLAPDSIFLEAHRKLHGF